MFPNTFALWGPMIGFLLLALVSMLVLEGVCFCGPGPVFADAGPEAEAYGTSKGYPVPPLEHLISHDNR